MQHLDDTPERRGLKRMGLCLLAAYIEGHDETPVVLVNVQADALGFDSPLST